MCRPIGASAGLGSAACQSEINRGVLGAGLFRPSVSYLNFASLLCISELLLTVLNNRRSRNSLHGRLKKRAAGMDENRRTSRRRVLKSAVIEFDRGAYSCAVRNLSEAGAALDVPYALAIPHEFKLILEADQVSRHCRVIWRKENRLGVAFEQVDNQPQL